MRRCNIPARNLPPCDEEWGHGGRMHGNAGDGFYAPDYDAEHERRQKARALKSLPPRKPNRRKRR